MPRLRQCLAAVVTLGLATVGVAQEEPLVTDRPDFTESANSVAPGRAQLETGYTFEEADRSKTHSLGEILLRLGWTESIEVRLGLPSIASARSPGGTTSGATDASLGLKIELAREDPERRGPFSADVALLLGSTLPTGSADLAARHAQPGATLALAWTLSERLGLGANVGATWVSADGEQFVEALASLALGIGLGDSWGAFVEVYSLAADDTEGSKSHYFDAGLTRGLGPNLQLDLRAGTGVGGDATTDLIVGAGLAYRW